LNERDCDSSSKLFSKQVIQTYYNNDETTWLFDVAEASIMNPRNNQQQQQQEQQQ
jgi:hypothetical protein